MWLPLTLILILFIAFCLLYRVVSQSRNIELSTLDKRERNIEEKYRFLASRKRSLGAEIREKENRLQTLQNSQEGIRTISAGDLGATDDEEDANDKISRYLIQQGKITLEQHQKVLDKMSVLQMDYIGVSLTLGFIDLKTAKQTLKANKVAQHSLSVSK
ncbi:hypothetical protein [Pseudodesulfovibrio tunisiensis]|uniref:hypothetical protein n=1 Tax=Pseudodesulfovibrio tunisiensis TaxID=463192 RepID=UPI001FB1F7BC|nr:hypothetical protein [Pseudodesulfovibrio tunisiensis]